jgi:hypothetical protein
MPFLIAIVIGCLFLCGFAILTWKRGTSFSMLLSFSSSSSIASQLSNGNNNTTLPQQSSSNGGGGRRGRRSRRQNRLWLCLLAPCCNFLPWLVAFLTNNVDRGALKVIWSCYQIIGTVSWNLSIAFPAPFNKLVFGLGFLQVCVCVCVCLCLCNCCITFLNIYIYVYKCVFVEHIYNTHLFENL